MAPLHLASHFGYQEEVEILLEYGADVGIRVEKTISKETPLHIAAGNGYGPIVKALLVKSADPNSMASNHLKTLLPLAVTESQLNVVKILLLGGAMTDTLSRFSSWCSPLHVGKVILKLLKSFFNTELTLTSEPKMPEVFRVARGCEQQPSWHCM